MNAFRSTPRPDVDEDMPNLGSCCGCGTTAGVRNILMLDKKAAIPGRGWGCVVCGLPSDGAVAVLCDPCFEIFEQHPPREACRGYPAEDGRMPYAELSGTHEHDMARHEDERYSLSMKPSGVRPPV